MALSNGSIELVELELNKARQYLNSFRNGLAEDMSTLRGNENYNLFIENTDIGRELNGKLEKMRDISESMADDLDRLFNTTSAFAEKQRRLNAYHGAGQPYAGEDERGYPSSTTGEIDYSKYGVKSDYPVSSNSAGSSDTVMLPGGNRVPSSAVNGGGH